MTQNEEYWKEKYDHMEWRHGQLLKTFQAQLVQNVHLQEQHLNDSNQIIALMTMIADKEPRLWLMTLNTKERTEWRRSVAEMRARLTKRKTVEK